MPQKQRNLSFGLGITQLPPIILSQVRIFSIKIDHKIYHFIADSLLKDAVLTVGVNLRLCLLSLCQ